MPITTILIANNQDDGEAVKTTTVGTYSALADFRNYARLFATNKNGPYTSGRRAKGFLRFKGITIAKGSIINSATLNSYILGKQIGYTPSTSLPLKFKVDGRSSIPTATWASTQASKVLTPTNILGTATTVVQLNYTEYLSGYVNATTKNSYGLYQTDVSSLISSLVTSYDYNNDEIAFYLEAPTGPAATSKIYVYQKNWDTGGSKTASLVINFTSPPVDKTVYRFI